jgi:hypothetical protein
VLCSIDRGKKSLRIIKILSPSEDAVRVIKVRYEQEDEEVFDNGDEKIILQQFSDYVRQKNPDIVVCMGDYDNGKVLRYLLARAE